VLIGPTTLSFLAGGCSKKITTIEDMKEEYPS